jgi:hypothetical protein
MNWNHFGLDMRYKHESKLLISAWSSCRLDLVVSYVIGIISQFRTAGLISSVAPRPINARAAALTHCLMRATRQPAKRTTVHGAGSNTLATRNARPRCTHREA